MVQYQESKRKLSFKGFFNNPVGLTVKIDSCKIEMPVFQVVSGNEYLDVFLAIFNVLGNVHVIPRVLSFGFFADAN